MIDTLTKTKHGIFLVTCWAVAIKGWAIDFDALEKIVVRELCQVEDCNMETDCDDDLKKRIGNDLPDDANSCHAEQQYQLLSKGLYLTLDGEIKNLPSKSSVTDYEGVKQKEIDPNDKVEVLTGPYIIDIQQSNPDNIPTLNSNDPVNERIDEAPGLEEKSSPKTSDNIVQNQHTVDSIRKPTFRTDN